MFFLVHFYSSSQQMTTTPTKTEKLYSWNLKTKRHLLFGPNQRFDKELVASRRKNQYSLPSFEKDLNNSYKWLIGSTEVVSSSPAGHFECWVPEGPGIQTLKSGYNRFSFRGSYYMCHVFVWHYHNPNRVAGKDISHLCSNEACCRPSHLRAENRDYNISRRGCVGYLVSMENPDLVIKVCTHQPPCTKTTPFSEMSSLVTLDVE